MSRPFLILLCLCAMALPARAETIAYPVATLTGLDKITGRITVFDVYMDETVQFGALQITPRVCYKRPATEVQRTSTFLEVDLVSLQSSIKRIFTGWMFADSPALNAVDHPVYDVWLTDCKQTTDVPPPDLRDTVTPEEAQALVEEPADPPAQTTVVTETPQTEPAEEPPAEPESSIVEISPPGQ